MLLVAAEDDVEVLAAAYVGFQRIVARESLPVAQVYEVGEQVEAVLAVG